MTIPPESSGTGAVRLDIIGPLRANSAFWSHLRYRGLDRPRTSRAAGIIAVARGRRIEMRNAQMVSGALAVSLLVSGCAARRWDGCAIAGAVIGTVGGGVG